MGDTINNFFFKILLPCASFLDFMKYYFFYFFFYLEFHLGFMPKENRQGPERLTLKKTLLQKLQNLLK